MGAPLVFVVAVLALTTVFKPVNTDKPPQEVVSPPVISSPQINTTEITEKLLSLSVPEERISVAVYELRDKTGQYKDDKLANRKSTAISQGATEMLITALDRSHQFIILDRVNFKNLLTEQDLRGKKRLAENNPYPELNKLIGAKYIVGG
ncbi:MAG: CsgG/HfaB family protein, partial [Candidatus Aerophobetes bacterium]|nr:CsgG/HfaB family protein [Candidatus Aerophobetes bacterium]